MKATTGHIGPGMCVAVMGYGVTGRSAASYCLSSGAKVIVSDSGNEQGFVQQYGDYFWQNNIQYEAGGHSWQFLKQADMVIVSPGIALDSSLVKRLRQKGIPVAGELAVAAPLLRVPVAAITGTNGKTTVTSLLGHILRQAGKKVFVGGNIGIPLLNYLQNGDAEYLVLELSSFQLETAGDFRADIGILLNISPDHIDRHKGFTGYVQAKKNLFSHQRETDVAILYGDDSVCMDGKENLTAELLTFGASPACDAITKGVTVRTERSGKEVLYDLTGTQLATPIGVRNSAAAILAAHRWEVEPEAIRSALSSFRLESHRMQWVGEWNGVTYINDSKATNTGAVIAALEQFDNGVILIAGGKHKGEDYSVLQEVLREKVKALVLLGESAEQIHSAVKNSCSIIMVSSLQEAVTKARTLSEPGDTVLLSPACASFDMFSSYGERGLVFMEIVHALLEEPVHHG
ncbi:UDP-N-acetylmuramoyl-L-alanine--D-glutamate ligase [Desulfopila sp. IMCC35008]|uniref:UDP-N-acetylmuramoyl-L-alanine--D-glutamate ligase n=1 Tax=Desulfopila sp. IMCC35008 TaxID=2653858 RepID=UPI0013D70A8F|nr:UDP-N-acetylmuramoyl-L-alanine--D-glutamate ligase [Desulfopila sp. IMCC35008]